MSRLSALPAGRTGQPPSRGGGCDGARATGPVLAGAAAGWGAEPEASAGTRPTVRKSASLTEGHATRPRGSLPSAWTTVRSCAGAGRCEVRRRENRSAGRLIAPHHGWTRLLHQGRAAVPAVGRAAAVHCAA